MKTQQLNMASCLPLPDFSTENIVEKSFKSMLNQISLQCLKEGFHYFCKTFIEIISIEIQLKESKMILDAKFTQRKLIVSAEIDYLQNELLTFHCKCTEDCVGHCSYFVGFMFTLDQCQKEILIEIREILESHSEQHTSSVQSNIKRILKIVNVDKIYQRPLLLTEAGLTLPQDVIHEECFLIPRESCVAPFSMCRSDCNTPSMEECHIIEQTTRKQAKCKEWHKRRRGRITSSNFKSVIRRKQFCNDNFLQSIFNLNTDPVETAAIIYGKEKEREAKSEYYKKTGRKIKQCGFIVNPNFPFLGASPDGKLYENGKIGLVEVKCPYKHRYETVEKAVEDKKFCLCKKERGLFLKPDHEYYYQVQGQLMISGADFLDFIVYTENDLAIIRIEKDLPFMRFMLLYLSKFYTEHKDFIFKK